MRLYRIYFVDCKIVEGAAVKAVKETRVLTFQSLTEDVKAVAGQLMEEGMVDPRSGDWIMPAAILRVEYA